MIARGSIILVEATGEQLFVLGVTGLVVTVVRGWAGTVILPITSAPGALTWVTLLTRAFEEGSDPPPGYVCNHTQRFNLVQIFRSTAEITGTADAVHYQYGSADMRTRMSAMNDHAVQIENAMLLGRRSESVQNGKPLRTMNGLVEHILTNRFTVPVTGMSYDMMNSLVEVTHMRKVRGYAHERIFYGGNRALTVMNSLAKAHSLRHIDSGTRMFGLQVNSWVSPHGEIKLITHPRFNSHPVLTGALIGYHPAMFRKHTLRPTRMYNEMMNGGRDTRSTFTLTEMTAAYGAEDTGILVNGLFNADPN
jgi:hypothetical protein